MSNPNNAARASLASVARRGLIVAFLLSASVATGYFGYRWLTPGAIREGPMLQRVEPDTALVVWYLNKDVPCEWSVEGPGGAAPPHGLMHTGTRYVGNLSGLSADTEYHYSIKVAGELATEARFRTAKRPGQAFQFVVFGDSGRGTPEQNRIAAGVAAAKPDFILHTGDLVYPGGKRSDYPEHFFRPYAALLPTVCFWPCLGNHDVAEPHLGQPYCEVFELPDNGPRGLKPEHNYWFDYGSARIAVLDSNLDEKDLNAAVAPWLVELFKASTARWKFVAFHHPPYTFARHSPNLSVQRVLVPAFQTAGVDIVFCGHDHLYERTKPMRDGKAVSTGGIVYIVSGAGGAELYEPKPLAERPDFLVQAYAEKHSFTTIAIDGDTLKARQIGIDGQTIDEWKIEKPGSTGG